MKRLKKDVKLFIIHSLASFESLADTIEAVKEEFGIEISRQQCEAYDPTKRAGRHLSQAFKDEFYSIREETNSKVDSIPVANISYRLKRIQGLIDHPDFKDNPGLVPKLLEQAAKEVGGFYTNRRELTGADGEALYPSGLGHFYGESE